MALLLHNNSLGYQSNFRGDKMKKLYLFILAAVILMPNIVLALASKQPTSIVEFPNDGSCKYKLEVGYLFSTTYNCAYFASAGLKAKCYDTSGGVIFDDKTYPTVSPGQCLSMYSSYASGTLRTRCYDTTGLQLPSDWIGPALSSTQSATTCSAILNAGGY